MIVANEVDQSLVDLQAGHTSQIARKFYGVEGEKLDDNLSHLALDLFAAISQKHHVMFGLDKIPGLGEPIPEIVDVPAPIIVSKELS